MAKAVAEILEAVGLVSQALLDTYLSAGSGNESQLACWRDRVQEIANYLLPDGLTEKQAIDPVLLSDDQDGAVSRHLLFAGLRLADDGNFDAKLAQSPFQEKGLSQMAGAFVVKSITMFDEHYFPKALRAASAFFGADESSGGLKSVLLPYIVLDHTLIDSETRTEESLEAKFLFEGRWKSLVQLLEVSGLKLRVRDEFRVALDDGEILEAELVDSTALTSLVERLRSPDNHHLQRFGLLDVGIVLRTDEFMTFAVGREGWAELSSGAQSALKLIAYDLVQSGADVEDGWLKEFEAIQAEEVKFRELLPSLGIEIQSTNVSGDKTFAWKEALAYFNIPSPRRPEFLDVVEVALRPVYSPRACLRAICILHAWGLHENYQRGSALHYSIGGDLGEAAKFLAIGLRSFVTEKPDRPMGQDEWYRSMRRVMSKGLVHRNPDSVAARAGEVAPDCHTEMRVLRLQNDADERAQLDRAYEVFIPGGQLLATAAFAEQGLVPDGGLAAELAAVWRIYRANVERLFSEPKFRHKALLEADWYEATGDPDDIGLLKKLSIVEAAVAVREHFHEHPGLGRELRERTNTIFVEAIDELQLVFERYLRAKS